MLYINEIFGWVDSSGILHEGLVDSMNEDAFQKNLSQIEPVWNKRDDEAGQESKFYEWFVRYKSDDITLCSTREAAGLGCPPQPYYTNSNEAINSALRVRQITQSSSYYHL